MRYKLTEIQEDSLNRSRRVQRPSWLPSYIPELQGLRGLAVLGVLFYHSHPRFEHTPFYTASLWGWAGVNLFFVLSGFLITSILLESHNQPHYFRNFYGRRVLRIWPVYVLVLAITYLKADWFVGTSVWAAITTAPWWAYVLFLQNLFWLSLPYAIGPTWSLAIEEQYYFIWAPVVRVLRAPGLLATVLAGFLIAAPFFRMSHFSWITPTHTLSHIDGISMGSLLALGLYTLPLSRRIWLAIGLSAMPVGFLCAATIAGGTAFLDTALTTLFGGAVVSSIAATGARTPANRVLSRGPLAFYGRISYGLYMTHIGVFIFFGWFDARMNQYGLGGDLAVIGFRVVTCTLFATILWYGFESRILRLKRFFANRTRQDQKLTGNSHN